MMGGHVEMALTLAVAAGDGYVAAAVLLNLDVVAPDQATAAEAAARRHQRLALRGGAGAEAPQEMQQRVLGGPRLALRQSCIGGRRPGSE